MFAPTNLPAANNLTKKNTPSAQSTVKEREGHCPSQ